MLLSWHVVFKVTVLFLHNCYNRPLFCPNSFGEEIYSSDRAGGGEGGWVLLIL